jgi:leader peptidase (prepilin peptidase) / N-methyltransferase
MSALAVAAFLVILAVVCVIDLRERRIPNWATGCAATAAVVAILLDDPSKLPVALIAAGVVAAPLLFASLVNSAGMGMGDVKLMAVIGLYLGWAAVPVLLAGLFIATFTGVALSLLGRRQLGEMTLPLAPFLTVAAIYPLAKLLGFPLH